MYGFLLSLLSLFLPPPLPGTLSLLQYYDGAYMSGLQVYLSFIITDFPTFLSPFLSPPFTTFFSPPSSSLLSHPPPSLLSSLLSFISLCLFSSPSQLALQLLYAYYQILSVLTNTQLQQIFERNPGFDLRYLLQGSEKFVDNILKMVDTDPSFLFSAVNCIVHKLSFNDTYTCVVQYWI